jgi:hypothetical protein
MTQWLLFVGIVVLLGAGVGVAWYVWRTTMRVSPQEEAYDNRVATMNERQANRLSDEQLTKPPTDEDAWALMVRRGQRQRRAARPARRRSTGRR